MHFIRTRADERAPASAQLIADDAFADRWEKFFSRCRALGPHLGPILFQLQPAFACTRGGRPARGPRDTLGRLAALSRVLPLGPGAAATAATGPVSPASGQPKGGQRQGQGQHPLPQARDVEGSAGAPGGSGAPPPPRLVFEFRHPSWFCEEVYDIMRRNDWCVVGQS